MPFCTQCYGYYYITLLVFFSGKRGSRNMSYIDINDTIFNITEKFPETVDIFVSRGFPRMGDYNQRAGYGKLLSLKAALKMKGLNEELFTGLLNDTIRESRESADITLRAGDKSENPDKISLTGLLPCPVRIPLMEEFNRFVPQFEESSGFSLDAELKAASTGTQWVQDHIDNSTSADNLPDLFISAGFDLFFDRERIGRLREEKKFSDLLGWDRINSSFNGLEMRDPDRDYSIIAAVPAVFLVNTQELGDRPCPQSWEEILSDEFTDSVSLPVGDFDLFNAILLSIGQKYGDRGIRMLGKVMLQAMHPSQMVKSDRGKGVRPAVTIMPYFFTKTVREGGAMKAVWPADGAVLSPIFMLAKKSREKELKPVAEFFGSPKIGEILAQQGLFPSLHPEVDNRLPADRPFMWLGWDYIKSHDLSAEIARAESLFNSASKAREVAV